MIDFRYHLVSVTAIFLALAVGIVFGTTALSGATVSGLRGDVRRLSASNARQAAQLGQLRAATGAQSAFVGQLQPTLVAGVLAGRRVAVLTAPGVPAATHDAALGALRQAGAVLSNDVRLAAAFADPAQANALDDLATRLVLPSVALPASATGPQLAAAELAAVLASRSGRGPALDVIQATLAGFQQGGFLSVAGQPGPPATVALLLLPGPPAAPSDAARALPTVARTLAVDLAARAAGAVVAGPAAAADPGGALHAVRADGGARRVVGTVDSVDSAPGRVAMVYALRAAAGGRVGAYGFAAGATAPLPPSSTP